MTGPIGNSLNVQRGDSAWKIAQRSLQARRQEVSNKDIVNEMHRLATLNGCSSVDDFNAKYFSTVGGKVLISNESNTPTPQQPIENESQQPSKPASSKSSQRPALPDSVSSKRDSVTVRRDTTQQPDSTRVARAQQVATGTIRQAGQSASAIAALDAQRNPHPTNPEYVRAINGMGSDEQRIIQYNRDNYEGQHYGIVDKRTCQLKIYNKEGKVVRSFPIGIGKLKGDNLSSFYMDRAYHTEDAAKAEQGRYTTPGEFTLDDHATASMAYTGRDGKARMMHLRGDNRGERAGSPAIHMIYDPKTSLEGSHQSADYQRRLAAINSPGTDDNRMSYGCVNLREEDYDAMHALLGEGDKIYILPEENGNKLQLERQSDGSYKFAQQHHKQDKRDLTVPQASQVKYDIRPERDPKYIAQQKAKQTQQQQRQVTQQPAQQQRQVTQRPAQQQKQEFSLFRPSTWFS